MFERYRRIPQTKPTPLTEKEPLDFSNCASLDAVISFLYRYRDPSVIFSLLICFFLSYLQEHTLHDVEQYYAVQESERGNPGKIYVVGN